MVLDRGRRGLGSPGEVGMGWRKARRQLCILLIDLSGLLEQGLLTEENAWLTPTQLEECEPPNLAYGDNIRESLPETNKELTLFQKGIRLGRGVLVGSEFGRLHPSSA